MSEPAETRKCDIAGMLLNGTTYNAVEAARCMLAGAPLSAAFHGDIALRAARIRQACPFAPEHMLSDSEGCPVAEPAMELAAEYRQNEGPLV